MKPSHTAAADELVQGYERMRQSVMEAGSASGCRGAALLISQGLAAWLEDRRLESQPGDYRHPRVQLPRPAQSEIVNVLTGVILNSWERSHAF